jgi:hypothetical protein
MAAIDVQYTNALQTKTQVVFLVVRYINATDVLRYNTVNQFKCLWMQVL